MALTSTESSTVIRTSGTVRPRNSAKTRDRAIRLDRNEKRILTRVSGDDVVPLLR